MSSFGKGSGVLMVAFLGAILLLAACAPAAPPAATPVAVAPAATPTTAPLTASPAATTTAPPKPTTMAQPTAAAAGAAAKEKPLDPAVRVRLGNVGGVSSAGFFIGAEKGYFAQEGLQVEMVNFRSAADTIAPLSAGQLEVAGGSPSAGLFNAMLRGIPIKIVADQNSVIRGRSSGAAVVRKDLMDSGTIKDYPDLKGKKVALNATGVSTEILMEKLLAKGGLTSKDVEIITMPFPDMLAAFANKAIDYAHLIEPHIANGVERGLLVRWKTNDEFYPNMQVAVVLYSPQFMESHPEAARRFMVGYLRALRDYNDAFFKNRGKAEIIAILTKNTEIKDPALFDRMGLTGLNPDGYVYADSVAGDLDWYEKKGLVQGRLESSKVIDNQYVDYALARLGKYSP